MSEPTKENLPPTINADWRPGYATNGQHLESDNGDSFLVAVRVCWNGNGPKPKKLEWWEFSIVTVECDEDYFGLNCAGDEWDWNEQDIYWYVPASELGLKTVEVPK